MFFCQLLDSSLKSLGIEFDATDSQYYSSGINFPKVLGLIDGSFALSWVVYTNSITSQGTILRFMVFI